MASLSFRNATFIFATNHGKSAAAIDPFKQILSATVEGRAINSDSLGTFTGEVERPGSMIDALRGKIRLAQAMTTERFILASEGSFSSADGFGYVIHNIEMLMLHDALTGKEILEQYISYDSNYSTASLKTLEELQNFLTKISFGPHALVLYPAGMPPTGHVQKGITDASTAVRIFEILRSLSPTKSVMAMSDMRAHVNPTRMQAIKKCCDLLARRLDTCCTRCGSGGFGLVAMVPGLPCYACGSPTQRSRGEKHACPYCQNSKEVPRADGKTTADPSECEWCNP